MISLYCSEKLDGIASAAIVMRHAMLAKLPVHFGGFLHPDKLFDELEEIAQNGHQLIFVLDIGLLPEHLPLVEKIALKNKIVYWCAHGSDCVIPPAKLVDRALETCCAELARARFLAHDLIARQLCELAREVKFWDLHDPRAQKLSDLIAFQYDPCELLESLSKGVFWNERFESFYTLNHERKIAALSELLFTLHVKNYLSYRFGFALASSILTSADACMRILEGHAGVDVACVLYRDGRFILRARDGCDVNVKSLAELFNGGGQPFAAGARLPMTISKENIDDAIFQLDSAFKQFFIHNV